MPKTPKKPEGYDPKLSLEENVNRKIGRPSTYSDELAATILFHMMDGKSIREISKMDGMPARSTIYLWTINNEEFSSQYARAEESRAHQFFDEIISIADDGEDDTITRLRADGTEYEEVNKEQLARSRLKVDARKWVISKMLPKTFGDKVDIAHSGMHVTITPETENL